MRIGKMKITNLSKGFNLLGCDFIDHDCTGYLFSIEDDCTGYLFSIEEGDEENGLITVNFFYDDDEPFIMATIDLKELGETNVEISADTDLDEALLKIMYSEKINFIHLMSKWGLLNSHATFISYSFGWNGKDFIENRISVRLKFTVERKSMIRLNIY